MTHSKYNRLMVIACLDTILNLPTNTVVTVTSILQGKDNSLNYPYVSWKNVHDGEGGKFPGLSLRSITQTPASEWTTGAWSVFGVKWNEWFFVFHAVVIFCVFGTTPEMRHYCRSVFWFIPERLGYKKAPRFRSGDNIGRVVWPAYRKSACCQEVSSSQSYHISKRQLVDKNYISGAAARLLSSTL